MSKLEKLTILGSLGSTALFASYFIFRPYIPTVKSTELAELRQKVLSNKNVRVLYSSMSFFYLLPYKGTPEGLYLLKDCLDVAKPKMVALQLSEQDYNDDYLPIVKHPQFKDVMKQVEYNIKTKNTDNLINMKELDITKGFENLYIVSYCQQNGCKVVYADENQESYDAMYKAKLNLKEITSQGKIKIPDHLASLYEETDVQDLSTSDEMIYDSIYINKKAENYVEKVMKQLQPKFSLVPDSPYKVLIGIVNENSVNEVTKQWKSKFMSVYGHQIVEDESQLQEEVVQ